MAASVAMILDAAAVAAANPDRAGDAEPHAEGGTSGAVMITAAVPPSTAAQPQPQSEDTKQFDVPTATAVPVEPTSVALVVDTADATTDASTPAPVKKTTPTGSRAKNSLGIPTSRKRGKKKSPAASHPSVGISVDALDKNKIWGNGRIIAVDVEEQRLKISFPSFSKHWDIWTDMLSIAPHCRFSNYPRRNARSWDGKANLFTGEKIEVDDDDECVSPERVQMTPHAEVVLAPSKPPVRKPKKGYVLVPVTEEDAAAAASSSSLQQQKNPKSEKLRKSSATLKRETAQTLDDTDGATPKPTKKARPPRELRVAPAAPPPVGEPYNDPELARHRAQNESSLARSAAFLSQCAVLWKQQLTAMSELDRKAVLAEKKEAVTADAGDKPTVDDAMVPPAGMVRESTVV